jgi:hypothetical protein
VAEGLYRGVSPCAGSASSSIAPPIPKMRERPEAVDLRAHFAESVCSDTAGCMTVSYFFYLTRHYERSSICLFIPTLIQRIFDVRVVT